MADGYLQDVPNGIGYAAKTDNMDLWGDDLDGWQDDVYQVEEGELLISGSLTNNLPIDVVSWSADGDLAPSLHSWWDGCLKLLVHI